MANNTNTPLIDALQNIINELEKAYWDAKETNIKDRIFKVREQLLDIRNMLANLDFAQRDQAYDNAKVKTEEAIRRLEEFKQEIAELLHTITIAASAAEKIEGFISIARGVFA